MTLALDPGKRDAIPLILNGQQVETCAETLADLLQDTGFGDAKVATARNGEFVPQRLRTATRLEAGDRIEVVSARQGG